MAKLITSKFRTHAAAQFIESINEPANTIYYIAAHRSIPFNNDSVPPKPENTIRDTHYSLYDELIFGKNITPNDMKHMIRKIVWTSGTIYDMYDDIITDLETKNFFVVSDEGTNYHIFKCLNNNGGVASTSKPLFSQITADDEQYITADGYQWKYLYTIDASTYNKFSTNDYIPVVINSNVSSNAISGSLSTIILNEPGSQYNSYASGTIKESAVGGNTLIYTLSSDRFAEYDIVVANSDPFIEGKVTSIFNGKTSTGVIIAKFTLNNVNILRVSNVDRAFKVGANLVSATNSSITSTILSSTSLNSALSSNTGFYNNNSFYIRSGTGAGQLRSITEYISVGDTRRVILNEPLNVIPDINSIFEIGPRVLITGDGVNASAIATVNPSSNSIAEIEILNSGSNYTYADVTIIANTGNISNSGDVAVNTTSAKARAIISPKGGHGSDVINELYATRVGISTSFINSENSTIPTENDFRKISIIKDPLFANVELTLSTSTATNFIAGEYIVQSNTGATGQITNRSGDVLRLTNIKGFFATGNSTVNIITGLTSNQTAYVSEIDRSFNTFDQRQIYNTTITYLGPQSIGFQEDELVLQTGLQQLDSDIVKLTLDKSAFIYNEGDLITQYSGNTTTANGIVISRYNNIIEVNPNYGTFVIGNTTVNYIIASTPSSNAAVLDVDNSIQANGIGYIHSNKTTYKLTLAANAGSAFKVTETIIQANSGASGIITNISGNTSVSQLSLKNVNGLFVTGNSTSNYIVGQRSSANAAVSAVTSLNLIGLTNVKGVFNLSDATSVINTFEGQTNGAKATLISRDNTLNSLVDGSGEFLYVENFVPISRNGSQTEKIKLIIEF